LDHESGNYAVEDGAGIVSRRDVLQKIVDGHRGTILEKLDGEITERCRNDDDGIPGRRLGRFGGRGGVRRRLKQERDES
jgi:hypothetical protein